MFYINQLRTSSFPIGLVKTESGFIVRSVEAGLGRLCTVPLDSTETELGSSDQEASPSAGKNTRVVLVPCSCMEVSPYSYFWWFRYF